MPKNTHDDQEPRTAEQHTKIETIRYANGDVETIRTETIGKDDDGNPTTEIENRQQSENWCENPWKLHPAKRVDLKVNGDYTDAGTLLCYSPCHEENDRNIKFNKRCAFFGFRKKTV